jgi:uncharacterized membrane protein (TIGR02234 family)
MRREFTLVLALGAVGAGAVVLAARQVWAHAIFTPPRPLPAQDISVTGQQLVPLASALALAALACLAAVIATRSVARRVVGALLALLGAGAAAAAAWVPASAVLATARAQGAQGVQGAGGAFGGSTTSGTPGGAGHAIVIAGSAGRAVASGVPWPELAVTGAVAIVIAGLITAWRGQRWPVMSARYERGAPAPGRAKGQAEMWESLSRDMDPTVDGRIVDGR